MAPKFIGGQFIGGQMDIARAVLCTCGWGGRYASIRAAGAAIDWHLEHEACEGCDHAVMIETDKYGAK